MRCPSRDKGKELGSYSCLYAIRSIVLRGEGVRIISCPIMDDSNIIYTYPYGGNITLSYSMCCLYSKFPYAHVLTVTIYKKFQRVYMLSPECSRG